jgi:glycosyltransferase involved in cell wall biosynthesis
MEGEMEQAIAAGTERIGAEPQVSPAISVVVPVYNEVENVEALWEELTAVLQGLGEPYEVIVVDDGSRDGTHTKLSYLRSQDPHLSVIRFRRNFGQTAAMAAGFDRARGKVILTMDGDLQNDPAEIPRLLDKIREGYDVVSGWRAHRKDRFLSRRLPSMVANWLIGFVTGIRLHDYGCSLKAYRREVIRNVRLYGEMHRFLPALCSWAGAEICEIPVNHRPRKFGRSKYGLSRVVRVILDLLTVKFLLNYATRPIQIFGSAGLFFGTTGLLTAAYLTFQRLVLGKPLSERPLLQLAILLILVGVQLVTMGLLGELTTRTYYEAQGKPIYVVREEADG